MKFKFGDRVTHCLYKEDVIGTVTSGYVNYRYGKIYNEKYTVRFDHFVKEDCYPKELTLYKGANETMPNYKFKAGDSVWHLSHGVGTVHLNTSNLYREEYYVRFKGFYCTCPANSLFSANKKEIDQNMKSENAKLTEAQFKAIQYLEKNTLRSTGKAALIETHIKNPDGWLGDLESLRAVSTDTFIRALYVGCEVQLTKEEQVKNILASLLHPYSENVEKSVLAKITAVYEGDK